MRKRLIVLCAYILAVVLIWIVSFRMPSEKAVIHVPMEFQSDFLCLSDFSCSWIDNSSIVFFKFPFRQMDTFDHTEPGYSIYYGVKSGKTSSTAIPDPFTSTHDRIGGPEPVVALSPDKRNMICFSEQGAYAIAAVDSASHNNSIILRGQINNGNSRDLLPIWLGDNQRWTAVDANALVTGKLRYWVGRASGGKASYHELPPVPGGDDMMSGLIGLRSGQRPILVMRVHGSKNTYIIITIDPDAGTADTNYVTLPAETVYTHWYSYFNARLSPDGTKIAWMLDYKEAQTFSWLHDQLVKTHLVHPSPNRAIWLSDADGHDMKLISKWYSDVPPQNLQWVPGENTVSYDQMICIFQTKPGTRNIERHDIVEIKNIY